MFRNAQGKFDGRVFMGVCLGVGSAAGLGIKLLMSMDGEISPFWMWAVPGVIVAVGVSVWLSTRRRDRQIRERLERSARVQALRRTEEPPTEEPEAAASSRTEG